MLQWFVLKNEKVTGPFSTEDVKTLAVQGQVQDADLIWGRLQTEWKPLAWWMVELPNLLEQDKAAKDNRQWHYALAGASFGPFSRDDLLKTLKSLPQVHDVLIWTKGMKAWAPIHEFNDVLDAIGINKRQYPRADIAGSVVVKVGTKTITGKLLTISEGGFGADSLQDLVVGQVISVELNCDAFYDPVHAKAEVRYMSESGYIGFKFQSLNNESKGTIVQYVKGTARTLVNAA